MYIQCTRRGTLCNLGTVSIYVFSIMTTLPRPDFSRSRGSHKVQSISGMLSTIVGCQISASTYLRLIQHHLKTHSDHIRADPSPFHCTCTPFSVCVHQIALARVFPTSCPLFVRYLVDSCLGIWACHGRAARSGDRARFHTPTINRSRLMSTSVCLCLFVSVFCLTNSSSYIVRNAVRSFHAMSLFAHSYLSRSRQEARKGMVVPK